MAKPIEPPPEWASDETNNDEPAALQKQTGWEFEQTGVSDYDNWWKRTAQKWFEYVDSNIIDGDLTIDGSLTVNDNLLVQGDADFEGDVNVQGTLSFLTSVIIPASAFRDFAETHIFENGASGACNKVRLASTDELTVPIQLPSGAKIKGYTVYMNKASTTGVIISSRMYKTRGATVLIGTETALGVGSSFNGNATGAAVNTETFDESVGSSFNYYMMLAVSTSAGVDHIYSVEVFYEHAPIT